MTGFFTSICLESSFVGQTSQIRNSHIDGLLATRHLIMQGAYRGFREIDVSVGSSESGEKRVSEMNYYRV